VNSRDRLIETTVRLLRSQGLCATGMNRIVAESRAPRGSLYHHFPGGKTELTVEALRVAGAAVTERIRTMLDTRDDTASALQKYTRAWVEDVRLSDFQHGCPVGNVAMDAASTTPALRTVCNEIFSEWQGLISARLVRDGVAPKEADSMAEFLVSALEGALILCRARRSTEPLERVADRIGTMLPRMGQK
jgi:AcrR family transcriptional regulator